MFVFIRDMLIGWIVFTQDGKKVANKMVSYVYKNIKKNITNSSQFKELVDLKDIFIKEEKDEPNKQHFNNRPKN
jgi:hypothetical protein